MAIIVGIGTVFNWWIVRDPGQPASAVEGKVRKAGRQPWHDVEGAWPGTLLEYHVTARNPGGADLHQVVVSISVPPGIRVLPETCRYATGSRDSSCPEDWLANGIAQPSLGASDSLSVVVQENAANATFSKVSSAEALRSTFDRNTAPSHELSRNAAAILASRSRRTDPSFCAARMQSSIDLV